MAANNTFTINYLAIAKNNWMGLAVANRCYFLCH